MAWPDSEEIERGVKEAGGDWEEARGLKLIHKFNNAILMGDPAGGVFIAVDKDDMHAMTRAVGVSHDDQVCVYALLCLDILLHVAHTGCVGSQAFSFPGLAPHGCRSCTCSL